MSVGYRFVLAVLLLLSQIAPSVEKMPKPCRHWSYVLVAWLSAAATPAKPALYSIDTHVSLLVLQSMKLSLFSGFCMSKAAALDTCCHVEH